MKPNPQSGNVIFLILIGIALFAALSYAVSKSTRFSGSIGNSEKDTMAVTDILAYTNAINTAAQSLIVSNVCTPTRISMGNYSSPIASAWAYGSNIDDHNFYGAYEVARNRDTISAGYDTTCDILSPAGGGVSPIKFWSYRQSAQYVGGGVYIPGSTLTRWASIPGVGTAKADLVIIVYGIKISICTQINEKFGIPTSPLPTCSGDCNVGGNDSTTQANIDAGITNTGMSASVTGHKDFCLQHDNVFGVGPIAGDYYKVLYAY